MKLYITLLFIFEFIFAYSQVDSNSVQLIQYTKEYRFSEGIYLDFTQVLNNSPIEKSKIISKYDSNEFDFFENVLSEENITIYDDFGYETQYLTENIWGYCNNGAIFIQKNESFCRIGIIGSLCHFVAYETVYDNIYPYSYGYDTYSHYPSTTTEMRQYLLNFKTGEIYDYTVKGVEIALMQDPELYDEFNNLKNRKKKKLMFMYIRKFNERNPLMVPEN